MKKSSSLPMVITLVVVVLVLSVLIYLLLPKAVSEIPRFTSTATSSSNATVSQDAPKIATSTQLVINRDACEQAGGRWNSCASSCRDSAPGTVCIQVCKEQCECGSLAHWLCPTGFECENLLPNAQDPAAVGICRTAQNSTFAK